MNNIEFKENINTEYLLKKNNFITNLNMYMNIMDQKCFTQSCKRRHEMIYGNFIKSFNNLQNFKNKHQNNLNKI